ncbi:MAG: Fe-only nitrogenase subunit delta [Planctomycetaceae bacterium]|jgi:nitrogenase delta subunit|nr:Fe-only nitrogenase subunit delta [Planctomycetaceae bacterium]
MNDEIKSNAEELVNYIMKKCLWQFHSRTWDRKRQNEHILDMTARMIYGEEIKPTTPEEKCYWADAMCLMEAFNNHFGWLQKMDRAKKEAVMTALKDRIDFLTVTGSLNLELTDTHY